MSATDGPRFQYDCSEGHELASNRPLDRCLAVVNGSPCPGTLKAFGRGSRKALAGASA